MEGTGQFEVAVYKAKQALQRSHKKELRNLYLALGGVFFI